MFRSSADESAGEQYFNIMCHSLSQEHLTERGTVPDHGLVDLAIVDDNVRVANGAGSHEVDGVAAEVGVGEELGPVPHGRILRGRERRRRVGGWDATYDVVDLLRRDGEHDRDERRG